MSDVKEDLKKSGDSDGLPDGSITLVPETFDPYVHSRFVVDPGSAQIVPRPTGLNPITGTVVEDDLVPAGGPFELELVEVTRYPQLKEIQGGFDHLPREPFALLFRASHENVSLISAMHTVCHDELGTMRLFLNPVQVGVHRVEKQPE